MTIAIYCPGPSVREFLPIDAGDLAIAVNGIGQRQTGWDLWAAMDAHMPKFQAANPDWRTVDWGMDELWAPGVFAESRRLTFPYTLAKVLREMAPERIDLYGVDMDGPDRERWHLEAGMVRCLDLSVCRWHGNWRP